MHAAQGLSMQDGSDPPVSVHFVNNVLAVAASYIEVEPESARDVLAQLGAFLSHRLRPGREVSLRDELEHVATYMRLEQARFPERVVAELPADEGRDGARCRAGSVQAPLAEALDRWLGEHPGRVRVAVHVRSSGERIDVQLDHPDGPVGGGERVRIALDCPAMTESVM